VVAVSLKKKAVREKVAFVPGRNLIANGGGTNTIRLNFSNATEAQIEEGIARLGRVILRAVESKSVPATV
jgi:DNA-binding transcriptional MocR family regulator